MAITPDPENTLIMETTKGKVVIALRPDLAPKHVERIKTLAREGFYDGIVFHRVIDGFMAQCGCPNGTGTGGSRHPNLPAKTGIAIGIHQFADPGPDFRRRHAQRNLRRMPVELAQSSRIHSGGMAARAVFLQNQTPHPALCKMQCGGRTHKPAADNENLGPHSVSSGYRLASWPRVSGLTGGRTR